MSREYPTPAWKFGTTEIPRPTHKDYIYHLETMNRREAREMWREGIRACWDHRCAYCNGTPIDDDSLTADHVVPKAHGGQDLTKNIVPACRSCNSDKGSEDWRTWYRKQDFYSPMREKEITCWMEHADRRHEEWWEENIGELEMVVKLSSEA